MKPNTVSPPSISHSGDTFVSSASPYVARKPELISTRTVYNRENKYPIGKLATYNVTMANGVRYVVDSGQPLDTATALDIPVTKTSAWGTTNRGINWDMMTNTIEAGFSVDHISIEQNFAQFLSLEAMAHNQLAITKRLSEEKGRDPERILIDGISRAAMTGIAMAAQAEAHDIHVEHIDLVVPCYAGRQHLLQDIGMYALLPLNEIPAVIGLLKAHPFHAIRNIDTFTRSSREIANYLGNVAALRTGDAGRSFFGMPQDIHGHVVLFDGDTLGQPQAWRRHIEDFRRTEEGKMQRWYPNIQLEYRDGGGHLSCALPEQISNHKKRKVALAAQYRESNKP